MGVHILKLDATVSDVDLDPFILYSDGLGGISFYDNHLQTVYGHITQVVCYCCTVLLCLGFFASFWEPACLLVSTVGSDCIFSGNFHIPPLSDFGLFVN